METEILPCLLSSPQSASAAVVRPEHLSVCVTEQRCTFTQLVRCAPGCNIHTNQSAQNHLRLQPSLLSRSPLSFFFNLPSFSFPPPVFVSSSLLKNLRVYKPRVFLLGTSSSPLFLSLSREIFLLLLLFFPLPATSSIPPPTLSPSPASSSPHL